jgi:cytochrome c oxidase cbb3-type subunit 3
MSPSKDEDRLLDHRYDDIQEYDNPLPGWWTLLLWATIVWAVLYFFNVIPGVGSGKGRAVDYDNEMKAAAEKYGTPAEQAEKALDVGSVMAALKDPARLAAGKETWTSTCVPCHMADGGGNIGPNLTDDWWIHGATPKDMLATVTNGVPEKGMPTWGPVLGPQKIADVVAYAYTLHGTKPAKAKEPQGVRWTYDASGPVSPEDTTKTK